jgi:hypothetical protein
LYQAAIRARQILALEDRTAGDEQRRARVVRGTNRVVVDPAVTCTYTFSGNAVRVRAMRSSASGMNSCPEYPGWMLMHSTMSASPATAATASGSDSGLNATPTCSPCSRAAAIVAGTSSTAS